MSTSSCPAVAVTTRMNPADALRFYLRSKTRSLPRYALSETLQAFVGWIPGIVGIGLRAVFYKAVLHAEGLPAIEDHVRINRPEDITLGRSVYIDHGVYLHGAPGGLAIGDKSWIMAGCLLHVFNYRGLENAGIRIGRRTFIGEGSIIRGQGGVSIGDNVLFGPRVMVLAVNHVFTDPERPIMDQGITAEGIRIEDNCWVGAGAIILDGVTVGRGSCIGAGAVVSQSIPPGSLAVGVPARVIRDLVKDPLPPATSTVYYGGIEQF
jgi:acetyltransferase-like isoleucine patch superfamily enzyme